jgi:hypothetical protein
MCKLKVEAITGKARPGDIENDRSERLNRFYGLGIVALWRTNKRFADFSG